MITDLGSVFPALAALKLGSGTVRKPPRPDPSQRGLWVDLGSAILISCARGGISCFFVCGLDMALDMVLAMVLVLVMAMPLGAKGMQPTGSPRNKRYGRPSRGWGLVCVWMASRSNLEQI